MHSLSAGSEERSLQSFCLTHLLRLHMSWQKESVNRSGTKDLQESGLLLAPGLRVLRRLSRQRIWAGRQIPRCTLQKEQAETGSKFTGLDWRRYGAEKLPVACRQLKFK